METGIVRFFDSRPEKRFGFIAADKGGDVFFHHNNQNQGLAIDYDRMPKAGDRVDFIRGDAPKGPKAVVWEFEPYVSLGDVAHGKLGDTSQNVAKYFSGLSPYPNLGHRIRVKGEPSMYHSMRVHRDDVEEFVGRVKKWQQAKMDNLRATLVYSNEMDSFFFSSRLNQPDVPEGFAPLVMQLPHMVAPREDLPDGMVTNLGELIRTYFSHLKEIPNPNPLYQPPGRIKDEVYMRHDVDVCGRVFVILRFPMTSPDDDRVRAAAQAEKLRPVSREEFFVCANSSKIRENVESGKLAAFGNEAGSEASEGACSFPGVPCIYSDGTTDVDQNWTRREWPRDSKFLFAIA
jgi:cold shock CspA family protein